MTGRENAEHQTSKPEILSPMRPNSAEHWSISSGGPEILSPVLHADDLSQVRTSLYYVRCPMRSTGQNLAISILTPYLPCGTPVSMSHTFFFFFLCFLGFLAAGSSVSEADPEPDGGTD